MSTIAACHKVFTENNGLEVNISVIIKRRKMINTRTLSQAAAHKSGFSTAGIYKLAQKSLWLMRNLFLAVEKGHRRENFFIFPLRQACKS